MSIAESLLPEFDHEMAGTRRTLERLPEQVTNWKPHSKSMEFNRLATLVAGMPGWFESAMTEPDYKIPADYTPLVLTSRAEMLALFDQNVATARKAFARTADPAWQETWSLVWAGQTVFTLPRPMAYRIMMMNHLVHHRTQLTVYLRLNDLPVPSLYGGSADED